MHILTCRLGETGFIWRDCPAPEHLAEWNPARFPLRQASRVVQEICGDELFRLVDKLNVEDGSKLLIDLWTIALQVQKCDGESSGGARGRQSWGRILMLFVFTGILCARCVEDSWLIGQLVNTLASACEVFFNLYRPSKETWVNGSI